MREKRRKKKKGEASEEETQLLKPCVQSADNQNRGWDPKCIMGDPTWLAVLLLSALSFSSLLWSVLAYFPEWRDAVMLTPPPRPLGYKCVSLQQGLTDIWPIPWCFMNTAVPCWHGPYLYCSCKRSWVLSLGSLVTSQWTTIRATEEDLIMQPYTLIVVTFFTINRALDQANWDGTISVLIPLYVSIEKC